MRLFWLIGLLFGVAGSSYAVEATAQVAAPAKFDQKSALQKSQAVVGKKVGDYTLLDRNGQPVRLADYRGKPLLVSYIYTSCAEVCPATTQYLAKAVKYMQSALGADSFAVVTVGFNAPWDSPQAMRDFAARQRIDLPNWEFLSADATTMQKLTRDLGFDYAYSVSGFDHISQLTIIDQEGTIHRQVYGDNFELPMMGEPLKKLVGNEQSQYPGWEGLKNRIRLFCTIYDPKSGEYRTDYSFFFSMFISVIVIYACFAWVVREWRRSGRRDLPKIDQASQ